MLASIFGRFARNGLPLVALAAVAVIAMLIVVVQADSRPASFTGYAELTVTSDGCVLDYTRSVNAERCFVVGKGTYQVTFLKGLRNTTPVVSRGSCCVGQAAASITGDRVVTVVVSRVRRNNVRVSIVVP